MTSMNMLAPGDSGIPFMFATVPLAATSDPPITMSAVLLELAVNCIPLRATQSNLSVVSWSNEVAVVVIANVLNEVAANLCLPVSDTSIDISVDSANTPLTGRGMLPSASTLTSVRLFVTSDGPAMGIALYLCI
jgi:hypothetical protein